MLVYQHHFRGIIMQKLFFSLTLLQLFSLSANSPFENMNYLHQAPVELVHEVFKDSKKPNDCLFSNDCSVYLVKENKILFVCSTNIPHTQYLAIHEAYYKKMQEKLDSKENQENKEQNSAEENKENETIIEEIVSKNESTIQDQE